MLKVDIEKKLGDFCLRVHLQTDGGITGLLGASGCGKSLTLRCIAGIEKPDSGHIELDGTVLFDSEKHINLPSQQRRVGYLFQNYALFPNMTVQQNIEAGLCREKSRAERHRRAIEMLAQMRLTGLEKHKPAQLSGGQQQRVALARILVSQPKLLLLDEPFSALDAYLKEKLQTELIDLLAQYNRDTLLVTHSRDEAYRMCEQLAVMERGHILRHGATKDVFADPGSEACALLTGCKNIVPARKIGPYEVEVPAWGIRLTTAQPVEENLWGIATRAHYYNPKAAPNYYPVTFCEAVEEPFEWILTFRYANMAPGAQAVWWRLPKDRRPEPFPAQLGIAPANILLLYNTNK